MNEAWTWMYGTAFRACPRSADSNAQGYCQNCTGLSGLVQTSDDAADFPRHGTPDPKGPNPDGHDADAEGGRHLAGRTILDTKKIISLVILCADLAFRDSSCLGQDRLFQLLVDKAMKFNSRPIWNTIRNPGDGI